MNNKSERLRLVSDGAVIHEFTYKDAWHAASDGDGYSLEIQDANGELGNWELASGWAASEVLGGTPGTEGGSEAVDGDLDGDGELTANDIVNAVEAAELAAEEAAKKKKAKKKSGD